MSACAVAVVQFWHQALNDGDEARLVAISSADIEVGGPRGATHGIQALREWFDRAGIQLEPRQVFHRDQTVVVEQEATWRAPGSDVVTDPQMPASVFLVENGRVTSVIRYADLTTALEAAGLARTDEV